MNYTIPKQSVYEIKSGQSGVAVWALQRVLNKMGIPTAEDGIFGTRQTLPNVKKLQTKLGVTADGVVGPQTQLKLAAYLSNRQEAASDLPKNLLFSKISYESSGLLGAVNWSVTGGVDCGTTQRRVYDESYADQVVIKRAFDAFYQVDLSGDRARELFELFCWNTTRSGTYGKLEFAWRVSVLNHNWPVLADRISKVGIGGLSSYYTTTQKWVVDNNLKFPDGAAIKTPLEWGQRYSLGNSSHQEPGQAVKLVQSYATA